MIFSRSLQIRKLSTIANAIQSSTKARDNEIVYRNQLFDAEVKKQRAAVGRVEKIQVNLHYYKENKMLTMNRNMSTPHDCAKHINDNLTKNSVVAIMNGDQMYHMHKPLTESCNLELLNFFIEEPSMVNQVFWRSCSFVLGAVLTKLFKDNVQMFLHSFPHPSVRSGSFVYDIQLDYENWQPTQEELKLLSLGVINLAIKDYPIEYLEVGKDLALEIFRENRLKTLQIPSIAEKNAGIVTLFRIDDHIDISKGPMISSTGQIGRCSITAIHNIGPNFYRVQGVALPRLITLNHYAFSILEDRSKNLNPATVAKLE